MTSIHSAIAEANRPNILWLIAEDLSPDLGCYGNQQVRTTNLDRVAREGMHYTRMFTTSGVCSPSRTAIAVGCLQTSVGAFHMRYPRDLRPPLPDHVHTIAELMQDLGYATANLGMRGGKPAKAGKDDWMFAPRERQQWTLKSWSELSKHEPFYAQVNFRLTHRPWERDPRQPVDPSHVQLPPYYPDDSIARRDWAAYLESIQVLDRQVGQVLELLRQDKLTENTIVFFVSDHGRPFTRAKYWCYDSGTRVPFLLRWPESLPAPPGYSSGSVSNRLLSTIDLTATTVALAGGRPPAWMQGRVFLGEQQASPRDAVFMAADRIGELEFQTRSIRTSRYRYVRNQLHGFSINDASTEHRKGNHPIYHVLRLWEREDRLNVIQRTVVDPLPPEQLFDTDSDPFEVCNLVDDPAHKAKLRELRERLDKWIHDSNDQGQQADSPEIVAAFQEYGRASAEKYAAAQQRLARMVEAAYEEKREP